MEKLELSHCQPQWDTWGFSLMEPFHCPVCGQPTEGTADSLWCAACVQAVLDEQRREDTRRVRKQEFSV